MADKVSNKDRWITMNGRHVLIKAGETPEQALARESKTLAKSESDRRDKEIAEQEKNTKVLTAEKNSGNSYTAKDGTSYSIEDGKGGVVLVAVKGSSITKNKILDPKDPDKARVKLTGKGLVYLKQNPNMLKLLKK